MSENEEKIFPKRRVYRRRLSTRKLSAGTPRKGLPPEDLQAFRELAPKLSPQGREVINLLLKVFNEKGEFNIEQLLNLVNMYAGQTQNSSLGQLLNLLPLFSASAQGGNQMLSPALLAGLLSALIPNRPR